MTPLRLGPDQVLTEQRVLVRPPARLRGRVVDGAGQPVAGLNVRVEARENPVRRDDTTDAEGGFEVGPLYDGAYRVALDDGSLALLARQRGAEDATADPVEVVIRDQQDGRVELVVRTSAAPAQ